MTVDFSHVDLLPLAVGIAAWILALLLIWLIYRQPSSAEREIDFQIWKDRENRPHADFAQFSGSEHATRTYLSKVELTLGITAFALLVLLKALHGWEVIS